MGHISNFLLKIIFFIAFPLLTTAIIVAGAPFWTRLGNEIIYLKWLILGMAICGFAYLLFKKTLSFWIVLSHELIHALFAALTLSRVSFLSASADKGGAVVHSQRNFLVTLAPYAFPVFSLVLLPISLILKKGFVGYLHFLIGITLMFYFISLVTTLRFSQPDIRKHGIIFSLVFILTMNLLFISFILITVGLGWHDTTLFLVQACHCFCDYLHAGLKELFGILFG